MNHLTPDPRPPLADAWAWAQDEARRCCAATLRRLRRGACGFYDEDDFWQDAFIAFLGVAQRAASAGELWAAWRAALAHGGKRIIARAPQRLWAQPERPYAPAALELEALTSAADDPLDGESLPYAARAALTAPTEAEALIARLIQLDTLEEALDALPLGQRQLLYMNAALGCPADELAALCGLPDAAAVRQRLRRARAALRKGIGCRA